MLPWRVAMGQIEGSTNPRCGSTIHKKDGGIFDHLWYLLIILEQGSN